MLVPSSAQQHRCSCWKIDEQATVKYLSRPPLFKSHCLHNSCVVWSPFGGTTNRLWKSKGDDLEPLRWKATIKGPNWLQSTSCTCVRSFESGYSPKGRCAATPGRGRQCGVGPRVLRGHLLGVCLRRWTRHRAGLGVLGGAGWGAATTCACNWLVNNRHGDSVLHCVYACPMWRACGHAKLTSRRKKNKA